MSTRSLHTRRLRGRQSPRGRWVASLLIVGAFTPYLGLALSIRWEHLLAYSAAVLVVASGRIGSSRVLRTAQPVLIPWLTLAAMVTISTGISLTAETGTFPTVRLLAIVDSFLLPVALVLVSGSFVIINPSQWKKQVRRAVVALVTLISLNTLLIVLFPAEQVEGVVRPFWANPTTVGPLGTVADRALRGGRYGGIFNQPFDGGLAYALALMGWSYLFVYARRSTPRSWVLGLVSLALLLAGGISTGSKVFAYGSVLVVAFTLLPTLGAMRSRPIRVFRGTTVVLLSIVVVSATEFAVFDRYIRNLSALGSDARTFSGGRWMSVNQYLEEVAASVSIAGRGWRGPQDDALIAYLDGGGIIGLAAFVAVFGALFRLASQLPRHESERALAIGMTAIMLAASLGAISLQVNRASSIYWVFLGLTVGHLAKQRRPSPPALDQSARVLIRRSQMPATAESQ
jgi:hypothetical protein